MDDSRRRTFGLLFTLLGSVPMFVGLVLFVLQLVFGEIEAEPKSSQLGPVQFGHEFAFFFISLGQKFVCVGLWMAASTMRSRTLTGSLAVGSIGLMIATVAAIVASATETADFGLFLPLVWLVLMCGSGILAMRQPAYRHGDAMEDLWQRRPVLEGLAPSAMVRQSSHRHLEGAWRRFAERHDGELKTETLFGVVFPRSVRFQQGSTPVLLETGGGRASMEHLRGTKITFELPQAGPLSCRVTEQGLFSAMAALFGSRGEPQGWDVFDDFFRVETNDPARTRQLLDRDLQRELLTMRQIARRYTPTEGTPGYLRNSSPPKEGVAMSIEKGKLLIYLRDILLVDEALQTFYEASRRLFEGLSAHRS